MNKNTVINLPVEIALTDGGTSHCCDKSIPLRGLTNIRGNRVNGFSWNSFNAAVVQKMLINDFIESIEIKRTEYSSSRMNLMDITKLIIYGIIYRKYIVEIRRILIASKQAEIIRKMHPGVILPEYNYNSIKLEKYFKDNVLKIDHLKDELAEKPLLYVNSNTRYDEALKQENRLKTRKFIDMIDYNTWFVLYMVLLGEDRNDVMSELDNMLISCIVKSDIAEYISLLALEILQSAERSQFECIARKRNLIEENNPASKYLSDPKLRDIIARYAEFNNSTIKIRYYFKWNPDEDKRFRFDISVIYDGVLSEKTRNELEKKTRTGAEEFLSAIYYSADDEAIPNDLGLYYFSYIEEACKKQNIAFNTRIISDDKLERTEYLMMFVF